LGVGGDIWRCVVLCAVTSTPVLMRPTIKGSAETHAGINTFEERES
jgi:hypothetical protein